MQDENKRLLQGRQKELTESEELTKEQIETDTALAIALALKDTDLEISHFWEKIPCKGYAPTLEEMVDYLLLHIEE